MALIQPNGPPDIITMRKYLHEDFRSDFSKFVRYVFELTNPGTTYLHNWHVDLMGEYLTAVENGQIKRLVINVPPRFMKSLLVNVAWPAWLLGRDPSRRILSASYAQTLSIKHSVDCRFVMKDELYTELFPDTRIVSDQDAKIKFMTTERGFRVATSTGAGVIGEGGDFLIVDDPHSMQDARSDQVRAGQLTWFDQGFSTRMDDKKKGAIVVIMQRLHQDDLTGHLLKLGDWKHLMIPIEAKKTLIYNTPTKEYVFKKGTLLHEERMGRKEVEDQRNVLQGAFTGQYMQDPVPDGGGIVKREWFRMWPADVEIPFLTFIVQSYDTAYTANTANDPSGCVTLGIFNRAGKDKERDYCIMVLDAWTDHLEYHELKEKLIKEYTRRYGANEKRTNIMLIEKKASGQSLVTDFKRAELPVQDYNPGHKDKVSRMHIASPLIERGKVYIPEDPNKKGSFIDWAEPFLKEVTAFPVAPHDEYADCLSQALIYIEACGFVDSPVADPNEDEDIHIIDADGDDEMELENNPYG